MLNEKRRVLYLISTIIIFTFCLNIKVIANKNDNSSIPSESTDGIYVKIYNCAPCLTEYGQAGRYIFCLEGGNEDCNPDDCGYGIC